MTYAIDWTNANAAGLLEPPGHFVRVCDAAELVQQINRRRRLRFMGEQDFSSQVYAGAHVRLGTFESSSVHHNLRDLIAHVLLLETGTLGGLPATPTSCQWLWPIAGADENKTIAPVATDPQLQVGLFDKLNGTSHWTDAQLTRDSRIRAVHVNEMRRALELLCRGRCVVPIYFAVGLFSLMPDTPWMGEMIGNDGSDELRAVGHMALYADTAAGRVGLADVTVRASSRIELTASEDCTVEVYRCKRDLDHDSDLASWNEYRCVSGLAWQQLGGLGSDDAEYVGAMTLSADVPASLSGAATASALQAMVDGGEMSVIVRLAAPCAELVAISASACVEYDVE